MSPPGLIPTHKAIADKFAKCRKILLIQSYKRPNSKIESRKSSRKCKSDFRVNWAREDANVRTVADKDVFDSIAIAGMDNEVDATVVDKDVFDSRE
ncbi:hypothetical protein ROZALSC1DRAFT_31674 [Rozella allomycis CSF55]|uniref:Uncharacterized protein n=1 Tax=Rozella allomycis (strain CSF55) TaxID=988480 RepID=A0A4P9YAZ1_ROZAC|nr:hypothetical protein ROZALSC1DRAFT_31674 [Rozella allomycis CSF55]